MTLSSDKEFTILFQWSKEKLHDSQVWAKSRREALEKFKTMVEFSRLGIGGFPPTIVSIYETSIPN